jgi:hypothetical protein
MNNNLHHIVKPTSHCNMINCRNYLLSKISLILPGNPSAIRTIFRK